MNTILLPTDFSEAAKNVAQYAIGLAQQLNAQKIIIYNAYQYPVSVDPALNTPEFYDIKEFENASEEGLIHFKVYMQSIADADTQIETISEQNIVNIGINEISKKAYADVVIMGITGKDNLEETLIGSTAIDVAKDSLVPVIIVPAEAQFMPVKNILFACDFKNVGETIPVETIKKFLTETGAKLFVVNIADSNKENAEEIIDEGRTLEHLFNDVKPEYSFIDHVDFVEGINQFATEKQIDLIIIIPKKHGWLESLFKPSHTRKLAFHSHVALMVIHE
ncbi:MAG: universal stress protein [Chitinophagaceae bacterium]